MNNLQKILNKTFPLERSLISSDNRKTLELFNNIVPLKKWKIKTGTKCFDWTVPKEWIFNKAILKDSNGNILIDGSKNILNVLNYSNSYKNKISKSELDEHLFYLKEKPNAIPYVTNYYGDNWGFCLSYNDYKKLTDDTYFVEIDTNFIDSELEIGEATIKGKSSKEIILSSYLCHPKQANDGLSGCIMLLDLYNKLKDLDLKYTYRFFFLPETIGSIALLSQKIIKPNNTEYAGIATCVGYGSEYNYKSTFIGNHPIDNIFKNKDFINIKEFLPIGSDERQFSSPNCRIPTFSLMKSFYEYYSEYHTSLDNLELISINNIIDCSNIYFDVILEYEKRITYNLNTKGGEPFLTKYNLYSKSNLPNKPGTSIIIKWILFYCDGNNSLVDIAIKTGYDISDVDTCIKHLISKEVIYENE